MTQTEAIAIAARFVADQGLSVGQLLDALYDDGLSRHAEQVPASWVVYYEDRTPADDVRRELWGDSHTIVIVDEATARPRLFCYL